MHTTTLMKMELLRMKHSRILAEFNCAIASANHETAQSGWRSNWSDGFDLYSTKAAQAEADLEKLIAESQPVTKS